MPHFLTFAREHSYLKKINLVKRNEWDAVRDDMFSIYKHAILEKNQMEIDINHADFLGSILFSAMEKGLSRAKTLWFFPHYNIDDIDSPGFFVSTTNEKIARHYHNGVIYLGFKYSYQQRMHYSLGIEIPNFLFKMLPESKNELWEYFGKLFNIADSQFSETVPHEDVWKKSLDNGKYGFYKFLKYLSATEIKPFSSHASLIDMQGEIILSFPGFIDLDDLIDKLALAVSLANKIYSYLFRKYHQKNKNLG